MTVPEHTPVVRREATWLRCVDLFPSFPQRCRRCPAMPVGATESKVFDGAGLEILMRIGRIVEDHIPLSGRERELSGDQADVREQW